MKGFDPAEYVKAVCTTQVDTFYLRSCLAVLRARTLDTHAQALISSVAATVGSPDVPPMLQGPDALTIDIPVTDACNLQCEACTHRASLLKNAKPRPIEKIEEDLRELARLSSSLPLTVYLLGGEPLLHPALPEIVRLAHAILPTARRCITTNMVLYHNGSALEEAMLETHTVLRYSDYEALRPAVAPKLKRAATAGLEVELSGESPALFNFYKLTEEASQCIATHRYCRIQFCPVLRDGEIWLCGHFGYTPAVNEAYGTHVPISKYDSVKLQDLCSLDELLVLLSMPHPGCKHCSVEIGKKWRCKPPSREDFLQ